MNLFQKIFSRVSNLVDVPAPAAPSSGSPSYVIAKVSIGKQRTLVSTTNGNLYEVGPAITKLLKSFGSGKISNAILRSPPNAIGKKATGLATVKYASGAKGSAIDSVKRINEKAPSAITMSQGIPGGRRRLNPPPADDANVPRPGGMGCADAQGMVVVGGALAGSPIIKILQVNEVANTVTVEVAVADGIVTETLSLCGSSSGGDGLGCADAINMVMVGGALDGSPIVEIITTDEAANMVLARVAVADGEVTQRFALCTDADVPSDPDLSGCCFDDVNGTILCEDTSNPLHGKPAKVNSVNGNMYEVVIDLGAGGRVQTSLPRCETQGGALSDCCVDLSTKTILCKNTSDALHNVPVVVIGMTNVGDTMIVGVEVTLDDGRVQQFRLPACKGQDTTLVPDCCYDQQFEVIVCQDTTDPLHGTKIPMSDVDANGNAILEFGGGPGVPLQGGGPQTMVLPICKKPDCCVDIASATLVGDCPEAGTRVGILSATDDVARVDVPGVGAILLPICKPQVPSECCYDQDTGKMVCPSGAFPNGLDAGVVMFFTYPDGAPGASVSFEGGSVRVPLCGDTPPEKCPPAYCCVNLDTWLLVCPGTPELNATAVEVLGVEEMDGYRFARLADGRVIPVCGRDVPPPVVCQEGMWLSPAGDCVPPPECPIDPACPACPTCPPGQLLNVVTGECVVCPDNPLIPDFPPCNDCWWSILGFCCEHCAVGSECQSCGCGTDHGSPTHEKPAPQSNPSCLPCAANTKASNPGMGVALATLGGAAMGAGAGALAAARVGLCGAPTIVYASKNSVSQTLGEQEMTIAWDINVKKFRWNGGGGSEMYGISANVDSSGAGGDKKDSSFIRFSSNAVTEKEIVETAKAMASVFELLMAAVESMKNDQTKSNPRRMEKNPVGMMIAGGLLGFAAGGLGGFLIPARRAACAVGGRSSDSATGSVTTPDGGKYNVRVGRVSGERGLPPNLMMVTFSPANTQAKDPEFSMLVKIDDNELSDWSAKKAMETLTAMDPNILGSGPLAALRSAIDPQGNSSTQSNPVRRHKASSGTIRTRYLA